MMTAINIVLALAGAVLLLPSAVFFVECMAALLPARVVAPPSEKKAPLRLVVMIPAYNESAALSATLAGLESELGADDAVLVIADNCTDDTAAIARAAGAQVIERFDSTRRGKGFALDYGIFHLQSHPPDVVVVLDADCEVAPGSIRRLAEFAAEHDRPAQAENLQTSASGGSPLASVSALAFLVRNRVRPTGLFRLGLPCHLMGTGMAFPWRVIRAAPPVGSHLVEDMQMGIELASRGFPPVYCGDAHVTSAPPTRSQAARGQRRRWEHGHIATLLEKAPQLIGRGIASRRPYLLAMGLDLLVPPLALLVLLLSTGATAALAWTRWGGSPVPFLMLGGGLALVTIAVIIAWLKFGRQVLSARYLAAIPFYVAWKLPLYFSFLLRGPYRRWERSERPPAPPGSLPTHSR